ncbi:SURF1-like protein [Anastrepha obliqua]|uniref:SURF1-like protein n=1 Tax=Anastrepha obliqua TaxID=95512 RepID=UPI00240A55FA|nr:SURF1-like protein [Anastrepha obliqua]
MLRLVTNAIVRGPVSVKLIANPAGKPQVLKTFSLVNRRCQSTRGTGTATMGFDSNKKIAPLGWFLLLIPVSTFGLGCWQVKRKAWKEQLIEDLEHQTKLSPVPLPSDLTELSAMEYQLVTIRGRFIHNKELLMGPRSFIRPDGNETAGGLFSQRDRGNGYLVITPFKLADRDEVILINRGWVSRNQVKPETRAEGQIETEVELTGVVRMGENRPQFSPDHKGGVFLYRDLPKMCALTGASPIILDATYESSIPGGPIGGQTRVTLRNEHLSYLLTWFSLSAITSYLWYRQIVKRIPY